MYTNQMRLGLVPAICFFVVTLLGTGCGDYHYVSNAVIQITAVAPDEAKQHLTTNQAAAVEVTALPQPDLYQIKSTAETEEQANDQVGNYLMSLTLWDQRRAMAKAGRNRRQLTGTNVMGFTILESPVAQNKKVEK